MLKQSVIEIDGDKFEINELSVSKMLPILPKLQNDDESLNAQMDIMRLSVRINDQPVGEGVDDIGLSTYMRLVDEVVNINGLGKGNDLAPTS